MASRNGKLLTLDNYAPSCRLQVPGGPAVNGFLSTQGVANFLNVPYATIPARFRTARRLDLAALQGELDATKYGPRCPQPFDPIHILMTHMFEQLSMEQYTEEFSCLDVNIYAPPSVLPGQPGHSAASAPAPIPVFAWIHGGAFRAGDNTTEFGGFRLGRPRQWMCFQLTDRQTATTSWRAR